VREALIKIPNGGAYAFVPRMFSLLLAMGLAGVIFTYPNALVHISHGILSLIMLGICAGFVHGVGFIQNDKLWRVLFGPWMAWGLMIMGLWILLKTDLH
jgi:predicted membrane protein